VNLDSLALLIDLLGSTPDTHIASLVFNWFSLISDDKHRAAQGEIPLQTAE
jgi:hypothetical protein